MAESKPMSYNQIADPNLLEPLIKEIEQVNKLLVTTEDNLKNVASEAAKIAKQTPLDSFKNIEKVEKAIRSGTEAVKELDQVSKERIKLEEKLKSLEDERIKTNFELKEKISLQTKALKENAKETVNSLNSYEKLLDRKKESRKELLRLTTAFGKNSDIVKEAQKEYKALEDSINDINSVVKREETAFERLNNELKKAKLNAQNVAAEFGANSDEARKASKEYNALKSELEDVNNSLKEQVPLDRYKALTADVNAAQMEFKKLAAEFGVNSKEAKKAQKEFENLDKELEQINERANDGRRRVGLYEKGVSKLRDTLKTFATATVVLKVFELLQNSISLNSEASASFEKQWVKVVSVVEVTSRRLVTAFPFIVDQINKFKFETQKSFLEFRKEITDTSNSIKEFFGAETTNTDDFSERINKINEELSGITTTSEDVSKAFEGIGDEIEDLTEKNIALIDKTLQYRKEIVGLQKNLADLIPTSEKLRSQFENDTLSLEQQIKAGVAFREELQQRFSIEEQISSKRLKLAQDNAVINKTNVDAQEELAAATLEYNQLIADQSSEVATTEREIQKLRDDAVQLNLDFYVDDAQNRINTNARIISDETQTFERRRELLEQNRIETEQANDLRAEALNESLKQRGKAELDFEELRKKQSSEEIARVIRESGLSEQLAIRALEIIRERRTELQDNTEAQQELNKSEAESMRLQDDIILQQEALNRLQEKGVDIQVVLSELSKQRLQSDIDSLQSRLDAAKEGSAEFVAINKELNDKLLEQNQQRLDKEKKMQDERKKDIQKFAKAANEGFQVISGILDEQSDKRISNIDKEISAEEKRRDSLRELANQGNEDAENNLALTEKRQAELEQKRQKQIERQEKQELIITAIQTYGAKVQAGDPNPLASTISDVTVLKAFIDSLPGFFEGTEDTGTVSSSSIDNKGGRLAVLHNNERVIDKANNKIIGQMSNTELAMIAQKEKQRVSYKDNFSKEVANEIRELKNITKNKPTYLGADYDQISDAIVSKIQKGNTLERIHKKNGGIWG